MFLLVLPPLSRVSGGACRSIDGRIVAIDPTIISDVVSHHLTHRFDYTSTTLLRTYPDGLDVEVMRADALAGQLFTPRGKTNANMSRHIYNGTPQDFRLAAFARPRSRGRALDDRPTAEDFAWITRCVRDHR